VPVLKNPGCTTNITLEFTGDLIFHRMERITLILPAFGW